MYKKMRYIAISLKHNMMETFKLLWQFKWYVVPYMLFYFYLGVNYIIPSPKNYCIWNNEIWYHYDKKIYLEITKLMLMIFALLFLLGTSNMRNHPLIAKLIFLSSFYFLAVFLQII